MLQMSQYADTSLAAAPPYPVRHFLFLQGLPGPFFRKLADALRAGGHRTSRINFNGGDIWDWRGSGATGFRGDIAAFPTWFDDYLSGSDISEVVLFGDNRPLHLQAIAICRQRAIRVFVVEEGMLRPNFVSFEQGGTNYWSSLPRNLDQLRRIADDHEDEPVDPVASNVRRRIVEAVGYYVVQTLTIPFFPHYRSHRRNGPVGEMWAWIRRRAGRGREDAASSAAVSAVIDSRFFLFPMQLDGDHQIDSHSDFPDMASAIDCVFHSFAVHAPRATKLLVKMHPFDPDLDGWRADVMDRASRYGIADRVYFIERFDLAPLLQKAAGVVTINSTVGPLALEQACPVFCLGRAAYDIPGVTAQCGLDQFWAEPPPVDAGNFELMCRAMRATALVNGGFHDPKALDMLVAGAVRRLTGQAFASPAA